MEVPPRSMVMGSPAKITRAVRDDEIAWKTTGTGHYHELAVRSMNTMREVEALTEVEAERPRVEWDSALPLHLHKNASA